MRYDDFDEMWEFERKTEIKKPFNWRPWAIAAAVLVGLIAIASGYEQLSPGDKKAADTLCWLVMSIAFVAWWIYQLKDY